MDEAGLVITRHKLTADEYHRMAENGILDEDDRVELIAGQIIDMAPMGVRHTAVMRRINHALTAACADRAPVSVRCSVHRAPASGQYVEPKTYGAGETLTVAVAPEITLRVSRCSADKTHLP